MSEDKSQITRRQFLQKAGITAAASFLRLKPNQETLQANNEIVGPAFIPGNYTEKIKENNLIPVEPGPNDNSEVVINRAINYLYKFKDALIKNPDINLPISDYFDLGQYPVTISKDSKLSDIITSFQNEIDSGQTVVETTTDDVMLGTINDFNNSSRTSNIGVGSSVFRPGLFTEENFNYSYFTDTELGLLILHEYVHARQGQAIFEKFLVNEAQANAIDLLGLFLLNKLNNSTHFPGTSDLDPQPEQLKALQQIDPKIVNLYQKFLDTVMKTKNVDDPNWLALAK
ncbi:hypothetical protein BH10PAT1_BH10PAT1_2390 [soil metagenome]